MTNEVYDVYFCDVIQCIQALYGNPEFAPFLVFKPEKHYQKGSNRRNHLYHDMHTETWWWATQAEVEINHQVLLSYLSSSHLIRPKSLCLETKVLIQST